MVFSSFTFLLCFLPLTVVAYYLVRGIRARNFVLCIASLIFYAWGEPVYILLMLASIGVNYCLGLWLERTDSRKGRKGILCAALFFNLGAIGLFKYGNFILYNLGLLLHRTSPVLPFSLPLGISFYTFQILSYVLDVYNGKTKVQRNLLHLATYIVLFPQLVAGPIVRYDDIREELQQRRETLTEFTDGAKRFAIGLGKKVILANSMASIADPIFDAAVTPAGTAWLAAAAYTLQIYFDFSGYSDMAIGMGKFFGFHFSENFNYPYIARSITDFWRRWHISLSTWFRDYVYIPLGGNRCSTGRNILNLLVVWMLTGLWHGASWNFVIWGMYYGVLLLLEKYLVGEYLEKLPVFFRHVITLFIVTCGWVIFRVEGLHEIAEFFGLMFTAPFEGLGQYLNEHGAVLENMAWLIPAMIACLPLGAVIREKFGKRRWYPWLHAMLAICVFYASVTLLMGSTYNPFIYFRF